MNDPAARLARAIAQLGAEHEPPPGWQARVLAQVTQISPRRNPWWLRWQVAAPLVLCSIAVVVLLVSPERSGPLVLAVHRVSAHQVLRGGDGTDGAAGDRFRFDAQSRARYRAIWVYRELNLVSTCPGRGTCRDADGELSVELTFDLLGTYLIVALAADHPLPTPQGSPDADLAKMVTRNVEVRQQLVHVW